MLAARQVGGAEHTKEVIRTAKTNRDPPNPGHGDVSFPQEGDWRMILRKGEVQIENSRQDDILVALRRRFPSGEIHRNA